MTAMCFSLLVEKQETIEGRSVLKGKGLLMWRRYGILYSFTSELACERGFLCTGKIAIW